MVCPEPSVESQKVVIHNRFLGFKDGAVLYKNASVNVGGEKTWPINRDLFFGATGEWKVSTTGDVTTNGNNNTTPQANLKFDKTYNSTTDQVISYLSSDPLPDAAQHVITSGASIENVVSVTPPNADQELIVTDRTQDPWQTRNETVSAAAQVSFTGYTEEYTAASDMTNVVAGELKSSWTLAMAGNVSFPEGSASISLSGNNTNPFYFSDDTSTHEMTRTNPITEAEMVAELTTKAVIPTEADWVVGTAQSELDISTAISRHTAGSYFYHYHPCQQTVARFRFTIPTDFEGTYYKIEYRLEDGDGVEISESSVEWIGAGVIGDDDSWATDWIEIPLPTSEGLVKLVPLQFKCYHSASWSHF